MATIAQDKPPRTSGVEGATVGLDIADLVNVPNLQAWLDEHVPSLGTGPLEVNLLHGGFSNVILNLDRGGVNYVLRRPPADPAPGTERTILREARVLSALDKTDVPHPRCYGSCEDPAVIGAPFYVMEKVKGWSGKVINRRVVHQPPFDAMPYEYRIPFAVVDALVALANVDYKAVGLSDFGKADNYLERQVDRWAGQLASYKEKYGYEGRPLPGYAETEAWLRANTPKDYRPGIIHGDIGTPNVLFTDTVPVKVAALVDWELSTIGDPMVDLGWFVGGMKDERTPGLPAESIGGSVNWPSRQELARYYAAGTGRDAADLDYYLILARFKSGCIMEYKVAQAAIGKMSREVGEFFSKIVLDSFSSAAELIRLIER